MNAVERIEQKLNEALGMKVRSGATLRLERELKKLHQEQALDAEEVLRRIELDPRLVRRLACALTVEETFFWRHPEHFELLVEHVRERLSKTADRPLLWSAGCASGEEPYSMAMAIHRALGADALARTAILATDVDATSLLRARHGSYNAWSFRGTSPRALGAYLEPHAGSDTFRVAAEIREAVHFEHESLQERLARFAPASVDVIFFRNVGIYLTEEAVANLYTEFARVIREGGLLVLGPADPLPATRSFVRRRAHEVLVHYRAAQASTASSRFPSLGKSPRPPAPEPAFSPASTSKRAARRADSATDRRHQISVVLLQAHKLADRGLNHEALSRLNEHLARYGGSADLLQLRGRIHLADGHADRSAQDLRAALELEPANNTLRFYYALALEALRDRGACRVQVQTLLEKLEERSDADALEPEASSLG